MAKISFSKLTCICIVTPRCREGDVSIERRCIKIAIISNNRRMCDVEHSFESSSKSNITLKGW